MNTNTITIPTYINLVDRGSGSAPEGAARISANTRWNEAWIEAEDFRFESWIDEADGDERYAYISVSLDQETERLLDAYNDGLALCYDQDPLVKVLDWESGGNPPLEIYWAVKYRGGLDICEDVSEPEYD